MTMREEGDATTMKRPKEADEEGGHQQEKPENSETSNPETTLLQSSSQDQSAKIPKLQQPPPDETPVSEDNQQQQEKQDSGSNPAPPEISIGDTKSKAKDPVADPSAPSTEAPGTNEKSTKISQDHKTSIEESPGTDEDREISATTVASPSKPTPEVDPTPEMKLSILGCFRVSLVKLCVLRGSVVDFGGDSFIKDRQRAAIVNAANEECITGGGVDGAISRAGGRRLHQARLKLPTLGYNYGRPVRCPTGDAKITGPGDYNELNVPFVIHAVGPNYHEFSEENIPQANEKLKSAYTSSLDRAFENQISSVGFSLLSAGIFRGPFLTTFQVLGVGLDGIQSWKPPTGNNNNTSEEALPPDVYLCGFTEIECKTLMDLCSKRFEKIEAGDNGEQSPSPGASETKEPPTEEAPQTDGISKPDDEPNDEPLPMEIDNDEDDQNESGLDEKQSEEL